MITNLSTTNQFLFYEEKSQAILKKALLDLKTEYENKDQEIFHSTWRKKQGYIPHGARKRTITTIFGKVTYVRHRYRFWHQSKYHFVYLSDNALGIEKYQRINNHLKLKILSLVAKGKRYQDILDCFPDVKLNYQTISGIIKKTEFNFLQKLMMKNLKKVKIENCLYINIDDTFLNLKVNNKKSKFRIRVILFHTGYDDSKSTLNKKTLNNKRVFYFLIKQNKRINTQHFMKKVYQLAKKNYSNINNYNVIISGDGAPWIRQSSQYWPNSQYVLDKFHAVRKLKTLFNPKNQVMKPIFFQLKNLLNDGSYDSIMEILNQTSLTETSKITQLNDLKSYFKSNKIGINNQILKNNIGCSIENTISHNFKWLLGYGSKAFSKDIYNKILILHLAKINKINIINLIQEQIIIKSQQKYNFFYKNHWVKPRP